LNYLGTVGFPNYVMTAPTPAGRGEDAVQLQFVSSCVFSFHNVSHLTKNKTKQNKTKQNKNTSL